MSTAKQQADTARIWRAIGRLEGLNWKKNERLGRTGDSHRHIDDESDRIIQKFDRINKKMDRLFYLVLVGGGVMIASIWISNLFGG